MWSRLLSKSESRPLGPVLRGALPARVRTSGTAPGLPPAALRPSARVGDDAEFRRVRSERLLSELSPSRSLPMTGALVYDGTGDRRDRSAALLGSTPVGAGSAELELDGPTVRLGGRALRWRRLRAHAW